MKPSRLFLAGLTLAGACQQREAQPAAEAPSADSAMTVVDSFQTPESVLYDSVMDTYIVSNINGAPTAKDDNGFLSRVSPSGRVDLKWVDGASPDVTLHAPKGMAIKGDTLFVADIDEVRLFDRISGSPLGSLPVSGATFLNDVDVGPDGSVYLTDSGLKPDFSASGTDAVYVRAPAGAGAGRFRVLARGADLGHPNGVTADAEGVTVVTFGSGEVYHLSLQGRRTGIEKPPHGQLDGIVMGPGGSLYASSWEDSSVVALLAGDEAWRAVHTGIPSPADIGYDSRRGRLLIPVFTGNRIEVRPLR
jgi:hypothetical protein